METEALMIGLLVVNNWGKKDTVESGQYVIKPLTLYDVDWKESYVKLFLTLLTKSRRKTELNIVDVLIRITVNMSVMI